VRIGLGGAHASEGTAAAVPQAFPRTAGTVAPGQRLAERPQRPR